MTTRSIRLAALLLAASTSARAATYYVATSGSDSAAGSSSAPFKTIAKGVAAAKAGDTIIVRAGSYPHAGSTGAMSVTINKAGTSSAWITLKSETKWGAILDGKTAHSYISFGGSSAYWIIDGFDIRGGQNAALFSNSGGGKNIRVINNHIHHVGNRANDTSIGEMGVYTDEAAIWEISGNTFNDIGRTTHITGNHDHGVYTHGKMTIVNNVFYNMYNGWHIQTAAGFSGTIANNTFVGAATVGKPGSFKLWGSTGNFIFKNNILYGPNSVGISVLNAPVSGTCSITNNILYKSGSTLKLGDSLPSNCQQSANKLNADPMLVNPAFGGDYHLKAGSPAIDAGVAVSGVTTDISGAGRSGTPDIGAYEYGATGGSTGGTGGTGGTGTGTTTPTADTAGPIISALSVTGLAANTATINWTTNEPADGYVEYGTSAALGQQTALVTAKTTAHAVILTGLTASTVYYYRARSKDAAGNAATSAAGNFTTPGGAVPSGCTASGTAWRNVPFATQTGSFTADFDAVPSGSAIDAVTGLSNGAASDYSKLAAAVRFNNAGRIDARNGGAYAAAAAIPYTNGQTYHVRMLVDLPGKKYTVYVRQGTGVEQLLGSNYAFRTEQTGTTSLSNVGLVASAGTHSVCKLTTSGSTTPTPTPTPSPTPTPPPDPSGCANVGTAWVNQGFTARTGQFTVRWQATPQSGAADGVMGLSNGAATDYSKLAMAVRFNNAGRIDARNGGAYAAAASIGYTAGKAYTFRVVADATAKRYSVYVTPSGGTEQLVGSNFAFRTEQAAVTQLTNLAAMSTAGNVAVCAVTQ